MEMRQFESLVGIADGGSFSRAAVTLNLAQPSLSRQIALLERELGQRLLVRTGRALRWGCPCRWCGHFGRAFRAPSSACSSHCASSWWQDGSTGRCCSTRSHRPCSAAKPCCASACCWWRRRASGVAGTRLTRETTALLGELDFRTGLSSER
jgi:hypothetical protein